MTLRKLLPAIILIAHTPITVAQEQLPTSTITAKLTDIDKFSAAKSSRVGESEGSQLISSEYIAAQQASTFADAMRKTTSVQVEEEGGQQGGRIFIRSFANDQVSVRTEGAPKNFNQVRHGGAGTIWLEPDMYQSINIVPGVASNVYGSGSLGGVVLLETKDPENILNEGSNWGGAVRVGSETNAQSNYISADIAGKLSEQFSLSATIVTRDTEQYKDGDGVKALLGTTGTEDKNFLLKGVYTPSDEQRLEMSVTTLNKEYTARTTVGSGAYSSTPQHTEIDDSTYSIQYALNPFDNALLDLNVRLSQANTERWRLAEGDTEAAIWAVDTRYFEVENISTLFQSDNITHQLRYGLDHTYDDVQTAYANSIGNPLMAERTQFGIYASDTIAFGESFELIASLRYDSFENDVENAPSTKETAVSPKLSLNWKPFENTSAKGLGFYVIAGKGFRTPSVHEARADTDAFDLGAETCSTRRGTTSCSVRLSNPNLKGESSDSIEYGLRFNRSALFSSNDQFDFQVGYIDNDAQDYISSTVIDTYTSVNATTGEGNVTQYINISEAEINGVELSINYTSDHWFSSLSMQNIDGEDDEGEKLPEINPASTNFTVGAYLFEGKSRVGIDMTKRAQRNFLQRGSERRRDKFTIYDIFASYQWNEHLLTQLRVENALDELYSKRSIVEIDGVDVTTFSPGRNIKLTMQYSF